MTIDRPRAHWGFTRMPFTKDLAPSMLHTHRSHGEAVARITWCIDEQVVGVVTGEVGAGKTVAVRAALAGIDASRHTVIYLGNPSVGLRGLYSTIVSTLGGIPRFHRASLIPQAQDALATEEHERGRRAVLVLDEATSNLDLQSETRIEAALDVLLDGRTAVLIAHRLSTAMRADRIVVVDGGRVVESGSHAELVASAGRYSEMFATWIADVEGDVEGSPV